LTAADPSTVSLLTNPEVLEVDQHSVNNRVVFSTGELSVWMSKPDHRSAYYDVSYFAGFNTSSNPVSLRYDLGQKYWLRDLWEHKNAGKAKVIDVMLPPHACVLYRVWR